MFCFSFQLSGIAGNWRVKKIHFFIVIIVIAIIAIIAIIVIIVIIVIILIIVIIKNF